MTDEHTQPGALLRLRWYVMSLPVLTVLAYAVLGATAVGLGYGSSSGGVVLWLTVTVSVALFVALGFAIFAWLLFEDDWWNDTMWEQTTALVLALGLHLAGLPVA